MGSIEQVKEALSAKARTTSLDELRERGKKQVRIIRAEHVAAMVAESVERALADSGMVPQDDLDRLIAKSRQEFAELNRERQHEHEQMQRMRDELVAAEQRILDMDERMLDLERQVQRSQGLLPQLDIQAARIAELELERDRLLEAVDSRSESEAATNAHWESQHRESTEARERAGNFAVQLEAARQEIEDYKRQIADLEARLASSSSEAEHVAQATAAAHVDVMAQVLEELATLKAKVNSQPAQPAAVAAPVAAANYAPTPVPAAGVDQLTAALSKLTQSMTDKMEAMGRKMGISSAVEAGPIQLDGLFKDMDNQKVESNLDSMEVKTKQAGGIAANLARLKKLKGS
jgi:myosin heavy subunit